MPKPFDERRSYYSPGQYDVDTAPEVTPAQALRDAARELEHQAEFDMTIADRWPAARQVANNRLINQSRELHARADAAEQAERRAHA